MLHAKTAVADGRWGRVGSSNLNIASWLSNCELDAMVENELFAHEMEEMYVQDLKNAMEIVLDMKHRVIAPGEPRHSSPVFTSGGGSTGRAAAGAIRIGNAIGAAFTTVGDVTRRSSHPKNRRIWINRTGNSLRVFSWLLAYPLAVLFAWIALALLYRAYKLHRQGKKNRASQKERPYRATTAEVHRDAE